jgi:lipoprotein-anchoring transpeptidase ErfK/SrfK
MNIRTLHTHQPFRQKLRHQAPPPRIDNCSVVTGQPEDAASISDAARPGKVSADPLTKGASLVALGISLMGALGVGNAVAVEPSVSQKHTIESLVRLVLSESEVDLGKVSNARFSSHSRLSELSEDKALTKGEEGTHIEAVQQALLDMGFAIEAGPTGALYNQTLRALNNFRASAGLDARQDLDLETLQMLDQLAPPPGKTLSEHPTASFPQAQFINGKPARVIVKLDEHRLFLYGPDGSPTKVYPVATGKRSMPTDPGLKIVNYKYDDPSPVAWQLWPESKGKAFGTKMLDLKWYNAETGEITTSDEEIHGTFARQSIGTDASSGCVRLYNEDVEALYSQLTKGDLVVFQ